VFKQEVGEWLRGRRRILSAVRRRLSERTLHIRSYDRNEKPDSHGKRPEINGYHRTALCAQSSPEANTRVGPHDLIRPPALPGPLTLI
jgi:hypothetical protein